MVERIMSEYVGVFRTTGNIDVVEIDGSLASYQSLVGGYLESVPTRRSPFLLLVDEEGKLKGKLFNAKATYSCGEDFLLHDIIVGDAVVVQLNRKRDDWFGWTDRGQCRYVCEMLLRVV